MDLTDAWKLGFAHGVAVTLAIVSLIVAVGESRKD